ncbi:hypothetical protein HDV00_008113 [Rhizophlyctis rosea]|nr:hypothetical protein HDV00_008113 [Rhizophlyctis rosea]
MFKHAVESIVDNTASSAEAATIYSYMRDLWEHTVSHYMYAAGGILQSFIYAYIYRDINHPRLSSWPDRTLWILATIFYGLTIGAVAIEFPYGAIVALVLILVWGFLIVGGYLWKIGGGREWGRRFVLQYYVWSYALGLVIVVGWVIHAKGFKNREEAGVEV